MGACCGTLSATTRHVSPQPQPHADTAAPDDLDAVHAYTFHIATCNSTFPLPPAAGLRRQHAMYSLPHTDTPRDELSEVTHHHSLFDSDRSEQCRLPPPPLSVDNANAPLHTPGMNAFRDNCEMTLSQRAVPAAEPCPPSITPDSPQSTYFIQLQPYDAALVRKQQQLRQDSREAVKRVVSYINQPPHKHMRNSHETNANMWSAAEFVPHARHDLQQLGMDQDPLYEYMLGSLSRGFQRTQSRSQ